MDGYQNPYQPPQTSVVPESCGSEELRFSTQVSLAASVLGILLGFVAVKLVKNIIRNQDALVGGEAFPAPPLFSNR